MKKKNAVFSWEEIRQNFTNWGSDHQLHFTCKNPLFPPRLYGSRQNGSVFALALENVQLAGNTSCQETFLPKSPPRQVPHYGFIVTTEKSLLCGEKTQGQKISFLRKGILEGKGSTDPALCPLISPSLVLLGGRRRRKRERINAGRRKTGGGWANVNRIQAYLQPQNQSQASAPKHS